MAELDIGQATTSSLKTAQTDYSVSAKAVDSPGDQKETYWDSPKWTQYHGYYKAIPELKKAIDALAIWTAGKGYETDVSSKVLLDHITGWGEDSFQSIMENMIVVKKVNGDSFAEIIRDDKLLLNIKPLNPSKVRIVVDNKGLIVRYEIQNKFGKITKKPFEIFHICNDRIADEIHGVSVIEACEKIILMRNEAMETWAKVLQRNINPLKIFEIDTDNATKRNQIITQYQNMTKDYEALFIPTGNMKVTIPPIPLQDPIAWIQYLENFFYQAVGIPKIILGGSQEFTEASSKVGYLTFEQVYMTEQRKLESDIWNQLGIKLTFNRPVSLKDEVMASEQANTGQVGFQTNELQTTMGRTE